MCLSRLDSSIKVKRYVGWQVFESSLGYLFSLYHGKCHIRKPGVWEEANGIRVRVLGGSTYLSGFHIILRKKDAEELRKNLSTEWNDLVVRKVLFKRVLTKGWQGGSCLYPNLTKTIVAKKRYIVPIPEK